MADGINPTTVKTVTTQPLTTVKNITPPPPTASTTAATASASAAAAAASVVVNSASPAAAAAAAAASQRTSYNYTSTLFFENDFFNRDLIETRSAWVKDNWHKSIIVALVYILLVFIFKYFMQSRQKFELRKLLVLWNLGLAAFSILGTIRVWPEFLYGLETYGIEYTVCDNSFYYGVPACWLWYFLLSKTPELCDTLFVVLRKQKLIFLHWYHHATVMVLAWHSGREMASTGRWFMVMNYSVHALMYTYYALRAMKFKVPKFVNFLITASQISQMVFGVYVCYTAYVVKRRGERCLVSDEHIFLSMFIYGTYFILFLNFFYSTYIKSQPKRGLKDENDTYISFDDAEMKKLV